MSRFAPVAALLLLLVVLAAPARAEVVPGEVVVRFAPDAGSGAVAQALDAVGPRAVERLPLPDTRVLTLPPGEEVDDAVERLERAPGVEWAEPNYVVRATRVPDDPLLGDLWGMRNLTTPGIDIAATAGWDTLTAATAAIGVADTGIMIGHPDLTANVDASISRDFVEVNGGGDPFLDGSGHGTHVAGTIGAVGDNGVGVAGVAWRARMGALRVLGASGSGTSAGVASGFAWAGSRNLPVVNASLGGGGYSQLMRDAIEAAPNTLFVVAAGNEGRNVDITPAYPCAYPSPNVLCVAAIDDRGELAGFSNRGATSVDVGAPGVQITSTYPVHELPFLDKFSTPFAGRWTAAGWTWEDRGGGAGAARPGDGAGSYGPGLNQTLTTDAPIVLGSRRGCALYVGYDSRVPRANGSIVVETSDDGVAYERAGILGPTTGYAERGFDLPDPGGRLWVRLRFVTPAALPDPPGAAPDVLGVAVRCVTGGSRYEPLNGTSMATPMVAGIAALVRTRQPGLTAVQTRQAIMESTKPLASLQGVTVTGGLVDLPGALARADAIAAGGGGGGAPSPAPPSVPERGPDNPDAPVGPAQPPVERVREAGLAVSVAGGQRIRRRGLAVAATPTVAGTLHVSGRLRKGKRTVGFTPVSGSATAGRQVTLRLRPGPQGRALLRRSARQARKAERRGRAVRPVRARVRVVLVAEDGTRVRERRTVRVR